MSYSLKIVWPTNPSSGDVYTSPSGSTWYFDGCEWIATCCNLPECDYITNGFTLYSQIDISTPEGPSFIGLPFTYSILGEIECWVVRINGSVFLSIQLEDFGDGSPIWTLRDYSDSNEGIIVATLNSETPIGNWNPILEPESGLIFSECNLINNLCLIVQDELGSNYELTTFPLYLNSNVEFPYSWIVISQGNPSIQWDELNSEWILSNLLEGGINATISGNENSLPIGSWIVDPGVEASSIITNEGECSCDPFYLNLNGDELGAVSIAIKISGETTSPPPTPFTNTIYATILWDQSLGYYSLSGSSLRIEEDSGDWYLRINNDDGSTIDLGISPNPDGPFTPLDPPDPSVTIEYIDSICGEFPNTNVCFTLNSFDINFNLIRTEFNVGSSEILVYVSPFPQGPTTWFQGNSSDIFYNSFNWEMDPSYLGNTAGSTFGPFGSYSEGDVTPRFCKSYPLSLGSVVGTSASDCLYPYGTNLYLTPVPDYVGTIGATVSSGSGPFWWNVTGPTSTYISGNGINYYETDISEGGTYTLEVVDINGSTASITLWAGSYRPSFAISATGTGTGGGWTIDSIFSLVPIKPGTTFAYNLYQGPTLIGSTSGVDLLITQWPGVTYGLTYNVESYWDSCMVKRSVVPGFPFSYS